MTSKELKKLSRAELLKMLIIRSKEVEELKKELQKANEELEDRRIMIENAGSIAEASLQLNGVFESAQKAAEQYLENLQRQADLGTELEKKSHERAQKLLSDTKIKCADMEATTKKTCENMVKNAELQAKKYWDDVSKKIAKTTKAETGLIESLSTHDSEQK